MSAHPLTQRHRAQQLLIRKDTAVKVARLWPALDFASLDDSFPSLERRLSALVTANRQTSTGVAAQYLRTFRREAGVRGDSRIVIPQRIPAEQFSTSLRVSSVVAVKAATTAGVAAEVAMRNALTLTTGAMSRLVLNAGRETIRATTIAEKAGWVRVGNGECDWCQQYLDGEIHYAEGYDFAAHDNCLLPGTVVTSGTVEAGYRRWYEGEVVVFRTAAGNEVSITPNHPVLTDRGWVDAGLLREGDDVVERSGADLATLGVPHEDDVPTRIEDVWRAHSMDGLTRVPVTAEDFHGDGVGTQGDVEVVAPYGLLPDVFYASGRQRLTEPVSAGAGAAAVLTPLAAQRDLGLVLVGADGAADGFMGGGGVGHSLFGREGRLMDESGGGWSAPLHSGLDEPSLHDSPTNPMALGQALFGLAGRVPLGDVVGNWESIPSGNRGAGPRYDPSPTQDDAQRLRVHADLGGRLLERLSGGVQLSRVSDLRRVDYSGHVYNLRTNQGWFSANSVVVSNCGCTAEPAY